MNTATYRSVPVLTAESATVVEALRECYMTDEPLMHTIHGVRHVLGDALAAATDLELRRYLTEAVSAGLLRSNECTLTADQSAQDLDPTLPGYGNERLWAPVESVHLRWPAYLTEGAAVDLVDHPGHYSSTRFGCECIDVTRAMTFSAGNAFKYVWRHAEKGGHEDLAKALVYLGWAREDDDPVFHTQDDLAATQQALSAFREHVDPVLSLGSEAEVYGALRAIVDGDVDRAQTLITAALRDARC